MGKKSTKFDKLIQYEDFYKQVNIKIGNCKITQREYMWHQLSNNKNMTSIVK